MQLRSPPIVSAPKLSGRLTSLLLCNPRSPPTVRAPKASKALRQAHKLVALQPKISSHGLTPSVISPSAPCSICLLYTSDAADEEDSVDLGGRRIIKKKKR
eukprot:TRINITY_DN1563_c0_g1_i3.p1 TRINITY_DN1563_c0_g1~~TRINITY_DN1563_c0_g1_i3.p1  ORF type:complete len:101 (+),score=15.40 TRINITY_DN1563_c0_g1_i3:273-575(+)